MFSDFFTFSRLAVLACGVATCAMFALFFANTVGIETENTILKQTTMDVLITSRKQSITLATALRRSQ